MSSFIVILFCGYLAVVADTVIAPVISWGNVAPSFLMLVCIVGTIVAAPSPWRVPQMSVIGLAFDLQSGGHAGIGMLAFALLTLLIIRMRSSIRRWNATEQALFCSPLVAWALLLIAVGNLLLRHSLEPVALLVLHAIVGGVYTAALSLPAWMLLAWLRESRRGVTGTLKTSR